MSSTLGGKLGLTSSSTWDNVVTSITNATVSTVLSFSLASTAYNSITFTWKNPASGGFAGVIIVGKTGSYPSNPTDGTTYYTGLGNNSSASGTSSTTLTSFSGSTTYYFRCWSYVLINNVKWYSDSYKQATITTAAQKGQKIFTTSQSWTVPSGVKSIDIFCVGAGGGGGVSSANSNKYGGGGGGGGYTSTLFNRTVTPGSSYNIIIGAGSTHNGGLTSFSDNSGNILLSANGGNYGPSNNTSNYGGDGGSGGGNGYNGETRGSNKSPNNGGSDGSNGVGNVSGTGVGQGTTTRAFKESSNTLYAGGGGGGGCDYYLSGSESMVRYYGASGGAGGGGAGATTSTLNTNDNIDSSKTVAKTGSANTGGGGGGGLYIYNRGTRTDVERGANGGSGICIVRWGY